MINARLSILVFITVIVASGFSKTQAEETAPDSSLPLPNPLTLEQALTLADDGHPDLMLARSNVEEARAQLLQAESRDDLKSYLDLGVERLKLTATGEYVNDHAYRLVVNKTLYDFGRSSALEESRTAFVNSREHLLADAKLQYQFEILKRFYDVILADFRYTVDDEEMTQLYLKYDKLRERFELGMVSEVEVLAAETRYREALDVRVASDKNQRSTRLLLAIALNRPDRLPAELVAPDISYKDVEIPEATTVFEEAMRTNPTILALQQEVEAARNAVESERARYRPTISAEVTAADYERKLLARGDLTGALMLRVPLYQGNETKAEIARASAVLANRTAQLKKAEQVLLKNISTLIKELGILDTKRKTAQQRLAYRDLDLEYKRALYEMEVQTTLSDAQARITEAQWLAKKVEYDAILTWAQINLLLGKPLIPTLEVKSP